MSNVFKNSIRINMPETNSSSCHSITIFGSPDTGRGDLPENSFKTTISLNDTLIIPGGESFDRGDRDVKDVMGKIQYACTGVFNYWDNSIISQERKDMLEKVLKDYLAVDYIEYHWDNPEEVEEWGEKNPDTLFSECPNIVYGEEPNQLDHDSYDKHDEIFENENTLRDFIFSSLSVAACGECNVTEPKELYKSLQCIGDPLVLRYKANNVSINYDPEGKENHPEATDFFDIPFLKEFPFLNKNDIDIFPESTKDREGIYINNSYRSLYFRGIGGSKNEHNLKFFRELGMSANNPVVNILTSVYLSRDKQQNWNICIGDSNESFDMAPIFLRESMKYPFPLYFLEIGWLREDNNIEELFKEYDLSEIGLKSAIPGIKYIKIFPELLFKGNVLNGESI